MKHREQIMSNQVSTNRFIYEKSVSCQGYLIIPFVLNIIETKFIYSYILLSYLGHKSQFYKIENPSELYASSIFNIVEIADKQLDHSNVEGKDYFR